jgi:hypothetical protein
MLLNRTTLSLAKLASLEESRYTLGAIAIERSLAAVTNGHYLVTVTHAGTSGEDASYPETPGLAPRDVAENETVLVHRDAALGALKVIPKKSTLPILQNAALGADGKLYVNQLDSVQSFKSDVGGKFPNWRMVMPSGAVKFETGVDARYLKRLAEYFIENAGVGAKAPVPVRMTFYRDAATAMRFDAATADGQQITAVLMPVRLDSARLAKRPDEVKAEETETADAATK